MPSLTRVEATARGALITVESYQVDLDLTGGGERFRSTVTIRFGATPAPRPSPRSNPGDCSGYASTTGTSTRPSSTTTGCR